MKSGQSGSEKNQISNRMIVIRNRLLPIGRRFNAINICGLLFVKPNARLTPELLNHERIHTRQMLELLIAPFYIVYVLEWLVRVVLSGGDLYGSYRSLSAEREAYRYQNEPGYLKIRRPFAQWRNRQKTP